MNECYAFEYEMAQIFEATNGRREAGSGAFTDGLDVRTDDLFIDCKTSVRRNLQSSSFTAKEWQAATHKASREGLSPVIATRLCNDAIASLKATDLASYLEELKELRAAAVKCDPKEMRKRVNSLEYLDDESTGDDMSEGAENDDKSLIFKPIRDYWEEGQAKQVKNHNWRGGLSPSAKISISMCMEDFFERVAEPLEFVPATLRSIRFGQGIHEWLQKELSRIPGKLYAKPTVPEDVQEWQDRSWPEVVFSDPFNILRMKCDGVINVDGRPEVIELKTKNWADDAWKKFVKQGQPEECHRVQTLIYINRFNAHGYYPLKIRRGRVAYYNHRMGELSPRSYKEMIVQYTGKDRIEVNEFIRTWIYHWWQYMTKGEVKCMSSLCFRHGSQEDS